MKKTPNKKLIGIFTIVSIVIFISIILMFIRNKIFTKNSERLVMYFDESINGLMIGSPVLFRGVEIGKVIKIDLMADTQNMNFSIPVFAKLNENQNFIIKNNKNIGSKNEFLKDLIKMGLKARLTTQSYLTGQLMIELEMLPNAKTQFKAQREFKNTIEIPTTLSHIGELSKGLQELPIKDIADRFNNLLIILNTKVPILLDQTTLMIVNANKILQNNTGEVLMTLENLNKTMSNIRDTARSIKNLTDYLERYPESLLKGKARY